jgi:hypothetical protein
MPETGLFTYTLTFPQCSNGTDDDNDGKADTQDLGCSSPTDNDESDEPVNVKLGTVKVVPLHPKAGGKAVVSAPALRVETSQAPETGTIRCAAKVTGGAALRGTGSYASGRALCTFTIPKLAKGKLVRGTITFTYRTATASRPFAFRTAAV